MWWSICPARSAPDHSVENRCKEQQERNRVADEERKKKAETKKQKASESSEGMRFWAVGIWARSGQIHQVQCTSSFWTPSFETHCQNAETLCRNDLSKHVCYALVSWASEQLNHSVGWRRVQKANGGGRVSQDFLGSLQWPLQTHCEFAWFQYNVDWSLASLWIMILWLILETSNEWCDKRPKRHSGCTLMHLDVPGCKAEKMKSAFHLACLARAKFYKMAQPWPRPWSRSTELLTATVASSSLSLGKDMEELGFQSCAWPGPR